MANYVSHEEVLEQAGFQFKERGEIPTGLVNSSNKDYYAAHGPFVDRNYDDVVDTTDVVVYVNGVAVSVASIVAAEGKVTLSAAPTTGAVVTIDYDWSNLDQTVVATYHTQAHDQIQSTLNVVYVIPLQSTGGNYVPDMVKLLEKRLTAGFLLDKEYSVGGDETKDTRGQLWIKWATQMLKDILDRKVQLMDASFIVLTQRNSGIVKAWPDNSTATQDEQDSGGDVHVRMKQNF